jgi:hypothetical protein
MSGSVIVNLCFEVTNSLLTAAYDLYNQSINLALAGTPIITDACNNLED